MAAVGWVKFAGVITEREEQTKAILNAVWPSVLALVGEAQTQQREQIAAAIKKAHADYWRGTGGYGSLGRGLEVALQIVRGDL